MFRSFFHIYSGGIKPPFDSCDIPDGIFAVMVFFSLKARSCSFLVVLVCLRHPSLCYVSFWFTNQPIASSRYSTKDELIILNKGLVIIVSCLITFRNEISGARLRLLKIKAILGCKLSCKKQSNNSIG